MNIAWFISGKLRYAGNKSFASTVIKIATAGVSLGVAVMLLSYFILQGFTENIEKRVFSFAAHLSVFKYNGTGRQDGSPMRYSDSLLTALRKVEGVKTVNPVCYKPALLKTSEEVQGIVIKGIPASFDTLGFEDNMLSGVLPTQVPMVSDTSGNQTVEPVTLSRRMASTMQLKQGDEAIFYFMQMPPRYRKVKVVGIYESGLDEFDENIVIANDQLIRDLNKWGDSLSSNLEISAHQGVTLDSLKKNVDARLPYDMLSEKVTDSYIQIFEWLLMIGRNVQIIITLITVVACFNMISAMMLMVLERTKMIGTLKALGAGTSLIKRIFVSNGIRYVLRGMLWGNVIGLGISGLQYYTKIIPMDAENYYISYVPIAWDFSALIWVNLLTLASTWLALYIPANLVNGIKPVEAMRFQ